MARHPFTASKFALVIVGFVCLFGASLSGQTTSGPDKNIGPCALLAKSDIQLILGKPVKEAPAADSAAASCEYIVEDDGLFSVLVKSAGPSETPETFLAGLVFSKIKTEEALGFGERSFYAYPGSGMLQLYVFKGGQWIVMTLMIPGLAESALKAPLEMLMKKALPK